MKLKTMEKLDNVLIKKEPGERGKIKYMSGDDCVLKMVNGDKKAYQLDDLIPIYLPIYKKSMSK